MPAMQSNRDWPIRFCLVGLAVALTIVATIFGETLGNLGRGFIGVPTFLLFAVACSTHMRRINWRLVVLGMMLQVILALLILRVDEVYAVFDWIGMLIRSFLDFTNQGTEFVFGPLAQVGPEPTVGSAALGGGMVEHLEQQRNPSKPFIFAFRALPAVIFVSSFFSVLYYFGILQFVVRILAAMVRVIMGTSGAETLSAIANVFMGQTEAPLIVKPYILGMTRSELLTLMVGGMATISGGVMVAYIGLLESVGLQGTTVAILTTSLMAAPAGLYLAKILCPETETPQTAGSGTATTQSDHVNAIDAAAGGASDGIKLAINIIAMLIAFIAFIAMANAILGWIDTTFELGLNLTLQKIFGTIFRPVAVLMGVPMADASNVGQLLGTKLVLNEFVAYTELTKMAGDLQSRSLSLTVFALTGFANFSSIGIQLGGIGSLPRDPDEQSQLRGRLAKLGLRALLGGFLATVLNATIAGIILEF